MTRKRLVAGTAVVMTLAGAGSAWATDETAKPAPSQALTLARRAATGEGKGEGPGRQMAMNDATAPTAPTETPPPAETAPPAPVSPVPAAPGFYGYPPASSGAYSPGAYAPSLHPRRSMRGYEDGQPVPPGFHVETPVRRGYLLIGALVFGIPYAAGLTVATGFDYENSTGWLAVPVVGPWIVMFANRHSCDDNSVDAYQGDCSFDRAFKSFVFFYLAADSIVQAVGAGFLIAAFNGKKVLVQDQPRYVVTPTPVGLAGYGAVLSGRF